MLHFDPDATLSDFEGKWRRTITVAFGRFTRRRIVFVSVPGTKEPTSIEYALAKRAVLVRAPVVEGRITVLFGPNSGRPATRSDAHGFRGFAVDGFMI